MNRRTIPAQPFNLPANTYLYTSIPPASETAFSSLKIKEAFMIVRLTFCKFVPERIAEAKKIYNEHVAPVVKKQKGNLNIRLLEPTAKSDDFVSITEWKTKADADAYHTSGVYKNLVAKLKDYFAGPAELKTYTVEEVHAPAPERL